MPTASGQINHIVDHIRRAFLIGLNDKAYSVPARQIGMKAKIPDAVRARLEALKAEIIAGRIKVPSTR